jgi:hypothetical protein
MLLVLHRQRGEFPIESAPGRMPNVAFLTARQLAYRAVSALLRITKFPERREAVSRGQASAVQAAATSVGTCGCEADGS